MRTVRNFLALIGLIAWFTGVVGCASVSVPVGHHMGIGFALSQQVIVKNNLKLPCEFSVNNGPVQELVSGGKVNVSLGIVMNTSAVFMCDVFEMRGGTKVHLGVASQIFYTQSGTNYVQEWLINDYQPSRGELLPGPEEIQ